MNGKAGEEDQARDDAVQPSQIPSDVCRAVHRPFLSIRRE
jgi:hypothetical protein